MSDRTGIAGQRGDSWAESLEAFTPEFGRWWTDPEQDGVAALHDVESEAGDEVEIVDLFMLDRRAARQLGVHLDSTGAREPVLY